jgi:hypothetical protein
VHYFLGGELAFWVNGGGGHGYGVGNGYPGVQRDVDGREKLERVWVEVMF